MENALLDRSCPPIGAILEKPATARGAFAGSLRDTLPTRGSLLGRLHNLGDSESWRTFFETYWRLIYNMARKNGLSDDQAQEVVQDTVIAVARKMPEFDYDPARGSFKNWLLLICRRRILDQLRRTYSSRLLASETSAEGTEMSEQLPDPMLPPDEQMEGEWEQEWRENIFKTALARVRQRSNPKHYQAFDYCVLQNRRTAEVASLLGISAAQVYLAKHRVAAAVKRAAKEVEIEVTAGQALN